MNFSFLMVVLVVAIPHGMLAEQYKRSLLDFAAGITCATGKKIEESFFDLNDYGCWCGIGGGGTPVDEIDKCCYHHDKCYAGAEKQGCDNIVQKYIAGYNWECVKGVPICKKIKEPDSSCGEALCQCDVNAAKCFASHPYPEHKKKCTI